MLLRSLRGRRHRKEAGSMTAPLWGKVFTKRENVSSDNWKSPEQREGKQIGHSQGKGSQRRVEVARAKPKRV